MLATDAHLPARYDRQAREESAREKRAESKKGKAESSKRGKSRDEGDGPANFLEGVGDFLFNLAAPQDGDSRARTKKLEHKPSYPKG